MNTTLYRGYIINPESRGFCRIIPDGALVVGEKGRILFCGEYAEADARFPNVLRFSPNNLLICPGFCDTHVHLPQFQAIALGAGELLDWLSATIFPLEARFSDEDFARTESLLFFRTLLANGTTSASVFCSSHEQATDIAFTAAFETGIRVCMGKSMMDAHSPTALISSAEDNIRASLRLAERWHGCDNGRLNYTLTPRFAGSCSAELLRKTGEFSQSENLRIQTHLAENRNELRFIASIFPENSDYTAVYERAGMLGERSIFAHGIYLSEREISTLFRHNCGIAHCPTSNRFLQSGVMPARKYWDKSMKFGLGTDIAGGYFSSILAEAREAIETSKTWNIINHENPLPPLLPEEVLWLATLGGARTLGLDDVTGNFINGKEADFLIFPLEEILPDSALFQTPTSVLARFVYSAPKPSAVFIRGKKLG